MDLKGSLIDTNLRIYPSKNFIDFLKNIPISKNVPVNVVTFIKDRNEPGVGTSDIIDTNIIQLTNADFEIINKIKDEMVKPDVNIENVVEELDTDASLKNSADVMKNTKVEVTSQSKDELEEDLDKPFLITSDLDWLYLYIKNKHKNGENLPFLNELLEDIEVKMPNNKIIKRNPDLEARCVKLRAQQEAREYRKMTKGVDNVRICYPEDSISYQMKQLNRHLIAIGQFLLSIFAGFLFGFRGVEWIVGNLDFGFRLLLGVMCALVIALAEIYFLAKKLNEELSVPETVQIGGPPKFANQINYTTSTTNNAIEKEHQD